MASVLKFTYNQFQLWMLKYSDVRYYVFNQSQATLNSKSIFYTCAEKYYLYSMPVKMKLPVGIEVKVTFLCINMNCFNQHPQIYELSQLASTFCNFQNFIMPFFEKYTFRDLVYKMYTVFQGDQQLKKIYRGKNCKKKDILEQNELVMPYYFIESKYGIQLIKS